MLPSGAFSIAPIIPSKSRPFVFVEKYGYVWWGRCTFEKIWWWLTHVGFEKYTARLVLGW